MPGEDNALLRAEYVVTGDGVTVFREGAVLIEGGRVGAVGAAEQFSDRRGDVEYNFGDSTILPGLINSNVHLVSSPLSFERPMRSLPGTRGSRLVLAIVRAAQCLRSGITTVRDTGYEPIEDSVVLAEISDRGLLPICRIVSGAIVSPTGGHGYVLGAEADGAAGMRREVRKAAKVGAKFIKVIVDGASSDPGIDMLESPTTASQDEVDAAVEAAHGMLIPSTAHVFTKAGVKTALRAGVDAMEHAYVIDEATMAEIIERGVTIVPTMAVQEGAHRRVEAGDLEPSAIRELARSYSRDSVGRGCKEGLRIAAGTDGGSPFNPQYALVNELECYVDVGMSVLDAIKSATQTGAELVGQGESIGSLAAGKLADVIVAKGNVTEDISRLRDITCVFKSGRRIFMRDDDGNAWTRAADLDLC